MKKIISFLIVTVLLLSIFSGCAVGDYTIVQADVLPSETAVGNCPDCEGDGLIDEPCTSSEQLDSYTTGYCGGKGYLYYHYSSTNLLYFKGCGSCGATNCNLRYVNMPLESGLSYLLNKYPDAVGSGVVSIECTTCNGTGGIDNDYIFGLDFNQTPFPISVTAGQQAELLVDVELSDGTTTGFTYQWYNGDEIIPGATNKVFDLSTLVEGTYLMKCKVTHSLAPTVYTRVARVDVVAQSVITIDTQLTGKTIAQYANDSVQLTATTSNSINKVFYTWFVGGTEIETTTRNTYNLSSFSVGTHSIYAVASSKNATDVTSATVDVVVTENLEIIINIQPQDLVVIRGDDKSISVSANFGEGVEASYQWYANDEIVVGSTTNTLSVANFAEGEYLVQCQISTNSGNYLTKSASLTVNKDDVIIDPSPEPTVKPVEPTEPTPDVIDFKTISFVLGVIIILIFLAWLYFKGRR